MLVSYAIVLPSTVRVYVFVLWCFSAFMFYFLCCLSVLRACCCALKSFRFLFVSSDVLGRWVMYFYIHKGTVLMHFSRVLYVEATHNFAAVCACYAYFIDTACVQCCDAFYSLIFFSLCVRRLC